MVNVSPNGSLLVTMLAIAWFCCPSAFASEAGVGAYWPGYRNFLTGIVPPKPGWYVRDDVVVFSGAAQRVVLNGLPVDNVKADALVETIEPSYVLKKKLFGATHAIVVTQPFVSGELSGYVIGTNLSPSGNRFAAGDTTVSPLLLGWDKGNLHYNTNLAIFIPNGDYDIHRVVNTSLNYWTFDPQFGITYLNPKTGWEYSGALGYSINTTNPATKYRSGHMVHLDYLAGRTVKNGLKPAIAGYAVVQVTPDRGSGAIFGSFESRVFGLGPALYWRPANGPELSFRYYHEFGARDHVAGNQYAFRVRAAF